MVELRGRGSPAAVAGERGGAAHTLASRVGGVQLLLEVVKLLSVVGVGGVRPGAAAHDGRVFVVAAGAGRAARTPHTAGGQGLGGIGAGRAAWTPARAPSPAAGSAASVPATAASTP